MTPLRVGSAAQIAGRSIPGRVFSTNFAVPIRAPVLPADTQACASPDFTRSMATRIEESFLLRMAERMSSSMPTTSLAATIFRRAFAASSQCKALMRLSSALSTSGWPTSSTLRSFERSRNCKAAGMVTDGPWSPPIASIAIFVCIILETLPPEAGPCSLSFYLRM